MNYRREIDGLRAVAVLPVILFHAGFTVFGGGYVGVDVFFVISGYLITSILITERAAGTYSLWRFYERRARRILPALFLVMAMCVPIAWLRMPPYLFEDFARSMAFAALFVSNVHFWENTGYFALDAEMQPLLHTWSLAVEEQFYLIFPLVLMALGAFRYWRFTLVFVILAGLSLALSEWGWRNYPDENFFFTFSRFWELLAGSLCAVWLNNRDVRANDILAGLGLGMIVFAILFFDSLIPFPSLYTLVPVVGSMLIILFAGAGTRTARLLSLTPFVGIGLISYSAYLWHQPLFAFARILSTQDPGQFLMAGLAVASLILAYLSWRFVEQPFRRRPVPVLPRRAAVFSASLVGIVVFVGFGMWGFSSDGFKSRLDHAMTREFAGVAESFEARSDFNGCFPGTDHATRAAKLCEVYKPEAPDRLFGVFGDSHAMSLIAGFGPVSSRFNATILAATVPACPPLVDVVTNQQGGASEFCRQSVEAQVQGFIDARAEVVFLVARWSLYATDGYDKLNLDFALTVDGQSLSRDPETALNALGAGLDRTLARLTEAGIKVVLVEQVPAHKVLPRNVFERMLLLRLPHDAALDVIAESFIHKDAHAELQARANSVLYAREREGITVVSLAEVFAVGNRFAWFSEGQALYVDSDHLSVTGANVAGAHLAELLDPILAAH
ncbi:MAG: acyltransferase family protein [Pseudomonadota bacterium]